MIRVVQAKAKLAPEGNELLAYADGACSGNPGPAGLGALIVWDKHVREISEYLGQGTNNIAELTATLRVLEASAELQRPVHLFTDSSYAIGLLGKGWNAKANQALVASLREAARAVPRLTLTHVRGHAGEHFNERADELARHAVRMRASLGWSAENMMHDV